MAGVAVVGGAFDGGGAGGMFLLVGHLAPWTIVPFRVGGIRNAAVKGGRVRHFNIRESNVGGGRVVLGIGFVEVHCVIGNGRIGSCGYGAEGMRSISVLMGRGS